ncbi:hypothetical protein OUZ56_002345 [Daphnia magna]|uniref:Uncharacterized protein n=1 Tax=Daphnia magna TaxID=35525 RepID=A0ABR0A5F8_9CRUS|nr:hypothetical protein OUZ56_002345 [Daphnia magna]
MGSCLLRRLVHSGRVKAQFSKQQKDFKSDRLFPLFHLGPFSFSTLLAAPIGKVQFDRITAKDSGIAEQGPMSINSSSVSADCIRARPLEKHPSIKTLDCKAGSLLKRKKD